jgi:hypothetical protein
MDGSCGSGYLPTVRAIFVPAVGGDVADVQTAEQWKPFGVGEAQRPAYLDAVGVIISTVAAMIIAAPSSLRRRMRSGVSERVIVC